MTLLQMVGLVALDSYRILTHALLLLAHCSIALVTSMYICGVVRCLRSDEGCDLEVVAECIGLCGVHSRFLIMFARRHRIAGILADGRKLWDEIGNGEQDVIR